MTEQIRDISKLKLDVKKTSDIRALLSYRNLKPMHKSHEYIMDNDEFSNTYRVLPINLKDRKIVLIRFYNFKYNPPRCVEISIPRVDFVTSETVTKRIDEIDAVITIHHEEALYIKSIVLIVQEYHHNLNFIHDVRAQTH